MIPLIICNVYLCRKMENMCLSSMKYLLSVI